MSKKLFELGDLFMTRGVADMIKNNPVLEFEINFALFRHSHGDWGEICDADKRYNDKAIKNDERLLSKYTGLGLHNDISIYIITEWDRSVTTILFPSEY